jgi:hypothetical protein
MDEIELADDEVYGETNVQQVLDDLAAEVAEDQAAIEGQCEDTRMRVIRMGKRLLKLQKVQKQEQDEQKRLGLPVTTWKAWCTAEKESRGFFPAEQQCRQYALIARHPGAYRAGMSIKEAYKEAGRWKKNGGSPPPVEKVTVKSRPLITIAVAAGKVTNKIERLVESNIQDLAGEQEWTTEEISGATDELTMLREACGLLLQILRGLDASTSNTDSQPIKRHTKTRCSSARKTRGTK